jgi:hypothetical protein
MRKGSKKPEEWEEKLGTSYLNPLQVLDMQDAIRERKEFAIVDGYMFSFKYEGNRVFYKPVDKETPTGYLTIDKFLEEL